MSDAERAAAVSVLTEILVDWWGQQRQAWPNRRVIFARIADVIE
jgi:hypothetical protein